MTQKTNTLRLVSETISEDHRALKWQMNKDFQTSKKRKQKFRKAVRLRQ